MRPLPLAAVAAGGGAGWGGAVAAGLEETLEVAVDVVAHESQVVDAEGGVRVRGVDQFDHAAGELQVDDPYGRPLWSKAMRASRAV
jgi:hypothetical protein